MFKRWSPHVTISNHCHVVTLPCLHFNVFFIRPPSSLYSSTLFLLWIDLPSHYIILKSAAEHTQRLSRRGVHCSLHPISPQRPRIRWTFCVLARSDLISIPGRLTFVTAFITHDMQPFGSLQSISITSQSAHLNFQPTTLYIMEISKRRQKGVAFLSRRICCQQAYIFSKTIVASKCDSVSALLDR